MARPLTASLLALVVVACSVIGIPMSAVDACGASTRAYGGEVVGAFDTTVGAVRRLQPGDAQPPMLPDREASYPAVLCYVDTEIPKAPAPGPNGVIRANYDRIVLAVVDGAPTLLIAGYRDRLPIAAP